MGFSAKDRDELEAAVVKLECQPLAITIANRIGRPVEKAVAVLPGRSQEVIQAATRRAIEKCLQVALSTLDAKAATRSADSLHKAACFVSGAIGGSFGLAALAAELPVSTTIMMRSIADIGRSEGENLRDPEPRLACLEVFALGGPSSSDDAVEVGYYAVRAALAQAIKEAAAFVAQRGFAESGAPAMVRLVTMIASRFGITVSEKAALQAVPVVGAVAGSAINYVFIEHFQNVARGHFIVRRLERQHGPEVVRAEYERLRAGMEC